MFEARVRPRQEVIFREIGGEAVVLSPEDGRYYGLDEVATRMWLHLIRTGRVDSAYNELLEEFDVGSDRLRDDLLAFVEELRSCGLIEIEEASSP